MQVCYNFSILCSRRNRSAFPPRPYQSRPHCVGVVVLVVHPRHRRDFCCVDFTCGAHRAVCVLVRRASGSARPRRPYRVYLSAFAHRDFRAPVCADRFRSGLTARRNFSNSYQQAMESLGQVRQFSADYGFADNLTRSLTALQTGITDSVGSFFSTVWGVVGGVAATFIVLVLSFYMVVEEERMRKYFRSLAPIEYQPYVAHLMKKMSRKMGEWLRGQIILGLIVERRCTSDSRSWA